MAKNPQILWGRVGATFGGILLAIPAGFFFLLSSVFSFERPPGSDYPWEPMIGIFVVFFLGPIAAGALLGRAVGRSIAKLHRDYPGDVAPPRID